MSRILVTIPGRRDRGTTTHRTLMNRYRRKRGRHPGSPYRYLRERRRVIRAWAGAVLIAVTTLLVLALACPLSG